MTALDSAQSHGSAISDSMRRIYALFDKHAHKYMDDAGHSQALARTSDRLVLPPITEAEEREIAAMWDAGVPSINTIRMKKGRAAITIKKAIMKYGKSARPIRALSKSESARLGVAARAQAERERRAAAVQLPGTPVSRS